MSEKIYNRGELSPFDNVKEIIFGKGKNTLVIGLVNIITGRFWPGRLKELIESTGLEMTSSTALIVNSIAIESVELESMVRPITMLPTIGSSPKSKNYYSQ